MGREGREILHRTTDGARLTSVHNAPVAQSTPRAMKMCEWNGVHTVLCIILLHQVTVKLIGLDIVRLTGLCPIAYHFVLTADTALRVVGSFGV
jgi:hypothetical protein